MGGLSRGQAPVSSPSGAFPWTSRYPVMSYLWEPRKRATTGHLCLSWVPTISRGHLDSA